MATFATYSLTDEELTGYLNQVLALAAREMIKDGLIQTPEQITDRYLAIVAHKGKLAKMFDRFFIPEDKEGCTRIAVVRVDNNTVT